MLLENFDVDLSAAHEKNLREIDKILLADDETKLKRLRLLAGEEGLAAADLRKRQTLLRRIADLERAAEMPPDLPGKVASAYQAASSFFDETEEIISLRRSEHDRLMSVGQSLQFQSDACRQAATKLAEAKRELSGVPQVVSEVPPAPTFTAGQGWIDAENAREKAVREAERSRQAPIYSLPRLGFAVPGNEGIFYADAKSPEHAGQLHQAFLERTGRAPAQPEAAAGQRVEPRAGSVQAGEDPPTMAELLAGDDEE